MKGTLRLQRLPQSGDAAVQYGRRMLTQLREWVLLDVNLTIGPYRYGWGIINILYPITLIGILDLS